MDMRGLATFIADIRKSSTKEDESKRIEKELAKIRAKFKKGISLRGYERKKYVTKMLYIYMLGYEIDFGHMEAVNLLSSEKYSEKHLGYLACTLLLNEKSELLTLITNSIKQDLLSPITNHQCLALTAIANVGGKEFAETLAMDIQKVLVAGETKTIVRKKAALCLLRMYQKYPEILPPETWAGGAIKLIGRDLGLSTSVMGLLLGLIAKNPSSFTEAVPKAIRLLSKIVINRDYTNDYLYYGVPCPWLQIKLLKILQYYPVPEDPGLASHIGRVLSRLILAVDKSRPMEKAKHASKSNATHSVLFEALNLAIHYDNDRELLTNAAALLGKYLTERDANLRYLALDTMARLALISTPGVVDQIKQHQQTILFSLKDQDISIRRRALDVLYAMCDRNNASAIVGELLDYLVTAEFAIREELVLKIAILAEKFATDLTWFVDVILTLIAKAGDFVSDEIWFRVVQIVTNNSEELQAYASTTVLQAVQSSSAHENAVKVAGYILGEFGDLIADQEGCDFPDQFDALVSKLKYVTVPTKSLLLSTFMKLFNVSEDAELRARIVEVFKMFVTDIDSELQQRAVEYLTLAGEADEDLLATILETMPHFKETQLTSLAKKIMERKEGEDEDEEEEEDEGEDEDLYGRGAPPSTAGAGGDLFDFSDAGAVAAPAPAAPVAAAVDFDSLFGAPSPPAPAPVQAPVQSSVGNIAAEAAFSRSMKGTYGGETIDELIKQTNEMEQSSEMASILEDMHSKFKDLVVNDSGVALEASQLQLAIKAEFHGNQGRIMLLFGNKTAVPLTQVRTSVDGPSALYIQNSQVAPMIAPKNQIQQYVTVECMTPFTDAVTLNLLFEYEKKHFKFAVRLPVLLTKFIEPLALPAPDDFFSRWNAIDKSNNKEMKAVFRAPVAIDLEKVSATLSKGFKFALLQGIDKANNFVAAGTCCTKESNIEVFVRLQCSLEKNAYSLTVRSHNPIVSKSVFEQVQQQLQ